MIRKTSRRAALLLVAGSMLWAGPVLAQSLNLPGVGLVVKKKPGNAPILVPADANGEVRIIGLEPGDYEVQPILICCLLPGEPRPKQSMRVGPDGRLAFVVQGRTARANPRQRNSPTAVQHYTQAIPFEGSGVASAAAAASSGRISSTPTVGKQSVNSVIFDMRQIFQTTPQRNHIDVNASSAQDITRLAPETSPAAAEALIAERTRGGAFKSAQDFAGRVCTKISIDFGDVPVRMGDTSLLVQRGGEPKAVGFKCSGGKDGDGVNIYGRETPGLKDTLKTQV